MDRLVCSSLSLCLDCPFFLGGVAIYELYGFEYLAVIQVASPTSDWGFFLLDLGGGCPLICGGRVCLTLWNNQADG